MMSHTKIQVGDVEIGILGLKEAVDNVKALSLTGEDEIKSKLLDHVIKSNYVPSSTREDYMDALYREYCKAMGLPFERPKAQYVKVTVLGPGCSQCDALEKQVIQVLNELQVPASFEHVSDIKEIGKYGFIRVPAVVVGSNVVVSGTVPAYKKLKDLLVKAIENQS
jgi:hypothetical protein